jgi:ribosomal-protein-alanine N-acetyltransferase
MKIKLEKLQERHIDDILAIEKAVFPIPWTRGMFMQELANPLAYYRVAVADEKVVAHGGLWTILNEGHITNIAVHPDYQRKGIASLLLEDFLSLAKEYEMSFLTLEVRKSNLPAQKLYQKYGFAIAGMRKAYYEDNQEDAFIMTLPLKPEK